MKCWSLLKIIKTSIYFPEDFIFFHLWHRRIQPWPLGRTWRSGGERSPHSAHPWPFSVRIRRIRRIRFFRSEASPIFVCCYLLFTKKHGYYITTWLHYMVLSTKFVAIDLLLNWWILNDYIRFVQKRMDNIMVISVISTRNHRIQQDIRVVTLHQTNIAMV